MAGPQDSPAEVPAEVWSETLAKQRVLRAEEQRGHLSVKTSSQMSQSARFLRSVVQGM